MKTLVTLSTPDRSSWFIAIGHPSDVSDRIIRIKRALRVRVCHGVTVADEFTMARIAKLRPLP